MVLSRSEIEWKRIDFQSPEKLSLDNTLLWVFNADRVPPHLGMSTDGLYFSLKVNGKDESIPVERIMELVDKKGIHTLVFEVKSLPEIDLQHIYSKYDVAKAGHSTCLDPIKESFAMSATTIHDLLGQLMEKELVSQVIGINIPEDFIGIPSYELSDIYDHLIELEGVQK